MPQVILDDCTLEYEEFGSGSPLLMLHGSGANWRLFAPQIETLGRHHRLIIPHMRGHGNSSPLPPVEYYHHLMADDTWRFMQALWLQPIPVYGESMGALNAALLAIRHPEAVSRLIAVCGFSEMPGSNAAWVLKLSNFFFSFFSMEQIKEMVVAAYKGKDEGDALARRVLTESICISKETFVQLKTSKFPTFTADLRKIGVPTLVMGGTGLPFEERGSRGLYRGIPDARLAIFAAGKDPLSATRQAAHDALVLDFLADRPLKAQPGVTVEAHGH
ncbi:MAG TPA: alpha/beta fold hydrolase [Symbiobacteriaceae bacterium]|nr:alpha/beta fold hydrolase [Symbiobacteriaceae bacterium]